MFAQHRTQTTTPVLPPAPPPSLAFPASRQSLIAIAHASPSLTYPPLLEHLASLPELIRRHTNDDVDSLASLFELDDTSHSIPRTLLADNPPAPAQLIDNFRIVSASESGSSPDTKVDRILFDFSSLDIKPPVMINFAHPFLPVGPAGNTNRASDAFQSSFPPPLHRSPSDASDVSTRAIRLGDSFSALRDSRSRSSSISSSFSSSPVMRKVSLSPWAAPFPANSTKAQSDNAAIPSLPMPMPKTIKLPAGLPARPGSLPPVFVKKESATLPQSMALPGVKPMGPEWSEEENISGNEQRRRRASEIGSLPLMRPLGHSISHARSIPTALGVDTRFGSQSASEPRPERLIKLGQSLRQSIAAKGER